jgi:hypothetical protein
MGPRKHPAVSGRRDAVRGARRELGHPREERDLARWQRWATVRPSGYASVTKLDGP